MFKVNKEFFVFVCFFKHLMHWKSVFQRSLLRYSIFSTNANRSSTIHASVFYLQLLLIFSDNDLKECAQIISFLIRYASTYVKLLAIYRRMIRQ